MTRSVPEPATGAPPHGHTRWIRHVSGIPTPLIFLGSVAIAVLLLWRQGSFADVVDAARRADGWTIVAALVLYLLSLALLCVRWHLLLRMIKGESNFPRASEAFLTSVVINYAAPIGLAVPTRAALTKRALGLSATETGAVVFWEIILDVILLLLASMLWLLFIGGDIGRLGNPSDGQVAGAATVVIFGIAVLIVAALLVRRQARWWNQLRRSARHTLLYPSERPRAAAYAFFASTLYWVIQCAVLWLLLSALTTDAAVLLALGLVGLPVLVGMLSPVPGGAGIREALMLGVARVHDADSGAVLLAALTYRVALFLAIPVLYLIVRLWLSTRREPPLPPESAPPTRPRHGTLAAATEDPSPS
jgi:uncharacterized protein (TIRG00374 family)